MRKALDKTLHAGRIRYRYLLPCVISSLVASRTSRLFGIVADTVSVSWTFDFNARLVILLLFLGILFGLAGSLFARLLFVSEKLAREKVSSPFRRIFFGGIVLAVLLYMCHFGRYESFSGSLLAACFGNGKVYWYDWILKMLLTILTLSVGFKGGEVTPLYTVGAALGAVLGPVFGIPPAAAAMLGYAGVFTSGTNTFLAGIMIGMEIFGFQYFPLFFIVCTGAYMVNRNFSIYPLQQIFEED